ncbi:YebC/PmpR family DNA-binding transcriptional regulator [Rickettsiales endosymbiont of Paramecium tredecaurelia]|uniref:YebC/PmpR family DNA-binding transcriptional regulator n=1 Tax=Candidatus Sarmatiella mevalonica TaxID=2770581 RepID=UPI0019234C83|nr:YebC/PmpR family DNA-binding transcriptional regulator [Candidatus Sarmatiella mevalonica]MBL3284664.1 YebC/PmpR family DNA-binding transcriptional regulator [Candidatus Sarmatiella mevalonica]
MAGHSKFKNIQHRKGAQDKKRAKIFTKLIRDISVAAKQGADPEINPRLKHAIACAKAHNLPKERIEKAIHAKEHDQNELHEIRYEGFLTDGLAVIVETITDNKNRTASDVRSMFNKFGGHMGEQGSASFMYDHLGCIIYPISICSEDELTQKALELGASDITCEHEHYTIYTDVQDFSKCEHALADIYGVASESYLSWKPHNLSIVTDEVKAKKLLDFIEALEHNEDVQNVFPNFDFTDEIIESLQ